jgi:hypothetical protein
LQSALVLVQADLQLALLALHWKLPHETTAPGTQVPVPLQVGAATNAKDSEAVPPLKVPDTGGAQEALPQTKPALASWHPPLPSHLPVLPQVEPVAQVVVSRGVTLAAIGVHVPALPEITQL